MNLRYHEMFQKAIDMHPKKAYMISFKNPEYCAHDSPFLLFYYCRANDPRKILHEVAMEQLNQVPHILDVRFRHQHFSDVSIQQCCFVCGAQNHAR